MRATRAAVVSCSLALACCQTTTDPVSGRTVMSVPSVAQMLGIQPVAGTRIGSADGYSPASAVEHYRGVLSGKTTDLTLTSLGGDRWLMHATMGMDHPVCIGDVTGRMTTLSSGTLDMTTDGGGAPCHIQITRGPGTATIGERDCALDHGGGCEFGGDLRRID